MTARDEDDARNDPASGDVIRGWMPGAGAERYVASAALSASRPRRR